MAPSSGISPTGSYLPDFGIGGIGIQPHKYLIGTLKRKAMFSNLKLGEE